MVNFEYYNPAKIVFGKSQISKVASLIKEHGGTRVLLVYGGGSIKKNGVYQQVVNSLNEGGLEFVELSGVKPNPRLSKVLEGAQLCKQFNADFILAVGGGSTIDTAKAIGVAVSNDCDVWDFYMTGAPIPYSLPTGVVLTIPAAGSETSYASVITNENGNFKRGIHDNIIIPRFAVIDPEVSYSLSRYQMSCGASDILAHLMERYFTKVENTELTDRMIEAVAVTIINNAIKADDNPTDYNTRAEIMLSGTFAHNNLLDCGRIGDWGSHNIEHELSGSYDIAHGAGLSIIFPAWIKYVWREMPQRFARFAEKVWGVEYYPGQEEHAVNMMIERLKSWYRHLGLPVTLTEAGIDDSKFEEMAHRALVGREKGFGNMKRLTKDDIIEIFKIAL